MSETKTNPPPPELREQLRSLSIPREQRPGRGREPGRSGGHGLTVVFALLALGLGGYVAWDKWHAGAAAAPTTQPAGGTGSAAASDPRPGAAGTSGGAGAPTLASDTPVLTATGKIVSDHRVEVATKVSGQIISLHFEQGDFVHSGQTLAEIEDVRWKALRDQAAGTLAQARAIALYEHTNYARVQRMYADKQASDIELADARRASDAADAEVAADVAALAFAEKNLADCKVVAPITGVVLERNVEVGDFVSAEGGHGAMANAEFGAIADMTKLRVEVDVNELDIGRLHVDMACVVIPDARKDRRYRGHVMWLDPGANYAKATVQVKVRIENPDEQLRVEGAAQVQFLSQAATSSPTSQPTPAARLTPASRPTPP